MQMPRGIDELRDFRDSGIPERFGRKIRHIGERTERERSLAGEFLQRDDLVPRDVHFLEMPPHDPLPPPVRQRIIKQAEQRAEGRITRGEGTRGREWEVDGIT